VALEVRLGDLVERWRSLVLVQSHRLHRERLLLWVSGTPAVTGRLTPAALGYGAVMPVLSGAHEQRQAGQTNTARARPPRLAM
jgi:hypothetical protein